MSKEARIIIYKEETGEIVKEIPINFWYSMAEDKIEDIHFNMNLEEYELKEGETVYIQLKLSVILKEVLKVMNGI